MTRAWLLWIAVVAALAGCRSPSPTIDPFVPYGPQRVPPPVTGSIGTPATQPAQGNYQGSSTTTISPPVGGLGWHSPGGGQATQPLAASPTTTANPLAANTVGSGARFTPTGNQTFAAPQVTNPAAIQSQPSVNASAAPGGGSVFGSGASAQAQPWQPVGSTVGSPQLLRTNAAPSTQPNAAAQPSGPVSSAIGNTLGIRVNGGQAGGAQTAQPTTTQPTTSQPGANGQPNGWGQPSGSQIPTAPPANTLPLNGMPVNDATGGYAAAGSPWSISGVGNWLRNQFGGAQYSGVAPAAYAQPGYRQPAYAQPAYATQPVNATQPAYVAQQPYAAQQVQQVQPTPTWPAAGYSTAAPTPTPLPIRGAQPSVVPASYPAQPVAAPQTMPQSTPVAPAALQWGSVPMASTSPGTNSAALNSRAPNSLAPSATVRGNDDAPDDAPGFVTSSQSSPTPHEAERYGHHDEYRWLRGQLEYSSTERRWKLRYIPLDAPEGRIDSFGGSVVLVTNQDDPLQEFQSGDFVIVQGDLGDVQDRTNGFAPLYHVQAVTKL